MKWLDLPAVKKAQGTIQLPGSKSISNRILLLAALAKGVTHVHDLLDSDDTDYMLKALATLGVAISQTGKNSYQIIGVEGRFEIREANLFLGNAGTAFRPLVAVLAFMEGHFQIFGVERMHERPIADLVDALHQIGSNVSYLEKQGYPPLEIKPASLNCDNIHLTVKAMCPVNF